MWSWLEKHVGPGPAAEPKRPSLQVVAPPAAGDPAKKALPPFEQFLALTGQDRPLQVELTPEELEADGALAEQVLTHFRTNRPAPSSLPSLSLQIVTAVSDERTSLADLSRLIGQDPAMTAGVLKVANSPMYRGAQEIETLRDAVTRLGLVEVGRVAGMLATKSLFQAQTRAEFAEFGNKWSEIFAESLVTARLVVWLSMRSRAVRGDHAFLGALLHDLGRSVGLRSLAAISYAGPKIEAFDPRIDRVLERVHVAIGVEVHELWQLPRLPTLVTQRHHDLGLPKDGELRDVHAVRLCSAMVQRNRMAFRFDAVVAEIEESCGALGLDGYELRSLDTQLREELQTVAALLAEKPKLKR